ncbi:MAG: DUF2809 domain-containing protein [Hyphomonadaceae bacterium]
MNRRIYAVCALGLFVIEVLIALFVRDTFVRPYVGDALAVAFVYCGLRAVTPLRLWSALAISYAIACAVETAQYLHVLDHIGLANNAIARTILGYGFELADFFAYAAGAAGVLVVEAVLRRLSL